MWYDKDHAVQIFLGKESKGNRFLISRYTGIMTGSCDDYEERIPDVLPVGSMPIMRVEPQRARFPCCLVWTPLPIVSWLAPFIGHMGICQEDGTILDFAGSYFVNVNNFAFGATARYVQLSTQQCCFPPHLSGHKCKHGFRHAELGTAMSWDNALQSCTNHFQHKTYNLFTCNCHSFVANCLNRLAYQGSISWNVVNVCVLIILKGRWVNKMAVARSFSPFLVVFCIGLLVAGWPFVVGMCAFSLLLVGWFVLGSYFSKNLVYR